MNTSVLYTAVYWYYVQLFFTTVASSDW